MYTPPVVSKIRYRRVTYRSRGWLGRILPKGWAGRIRIRIVGTRPWVGYDVNLVLLVRRRRNPELGHSNKMPRGCVIAMMAPVSDCVYDSSGARRVLGLLVSDKK